MNNKFKDLFISYGRRESLGFVARLHQQLKLAGYDAWFDKVNIPDGDDYALRINHGIESAHNFVYVMAPRCLTSPYCLLELEYARLLGKRVIPINQMVIFQAPSLELSAGDQQVLVNFYEFFNQPNPNIRTTQQVLDRSLALIGKTDWLDAKEELSDDDCQLLAKWAQHNWAWHDDVNLLKKVSLPVFGKTIDALDGVVERVKAVLERHKDYVHSHTEILAHALSWQNQRKATQYLLVGKERTIAEEWLLTDFLPPKQPPCQPTALVCEYIGEARKNAENLMTDIFICYDAQDKDIRNNVVQSLSRYAKTTWRHDRDIQKGADYDRAIEQGIENADHFFFFISPDSVASEYCQRELAHALQYNKRIVPLLVAPTPKSKIPEVLRSLQHIDFTENTGQADYDNDIGEILNILRQEQSYYKQHKILLVYALKWQNQNRNPSILLRGYNLQHFEIWLKTAKQRIQYSPLPLQVEFIQESRQQSAHLTLDVFISYSRADSDFARQLNDAFQLQGKTTWFDQESIAAGVDFQKEIYKGIEKANNFLFIISPSSINSPYCANDLEYAQSLNKRIVTILHRAVSPNELHLVLAGIHWIDFNQRYFHANFNEVVKTIDTNNKQARRHTKWTLRALEWAHKNKSVDLLLQGNELADAPKGLTETTQNDKKSPVTDSQKSDLADAQKGLTETTQNDKKSPVTDSQKSDLSAAQAPAKRQLRRGRLLQTLSVFLIVLFVVITAVYSGYIASELGQEALFEKSQSHITSIRNEKKTQIENYFNGLFTQIHVYADAKTTVEAMYGLKEAYPRFKEEANLPTNFENLDDGFVMKGALTPLPIEEYKVALRDYYINDFSQEYGTLNLNEAPDMEEILNQLDDNSIALQYNYIAANPNPLGTKEEYFAATDASGYTQLHRHYHPYFHDIQRRFDFEDIFLVDVDTGHVIYSVLKEIDFATSLKEGPYAKTGIGEVFQNVSQLGQGGIGGLVDFAPYLPSFDSQAAFIGTPIYDGEQKIGILIFQIPIHSINDIMTEQLVWLDDKYGRTGEAYIVAADGTMRNDSRMLIEDKEGYLWAMRQAELPEVLIYNIELKGTSVGLQRVDNPGIRSAFSGITGFDFYEDYQGEFVLSAFAPINVPGLQWAIFYTLSEEESIEQLDTLSTEINKATILIISLIPIFYLIYFAFPIVLSALKSVPKTTLSALKSVLKTTLFALKSVLKTTLSALKLVLKSSIIVVGVAVVVIMPPALYYYDLADQMAVKVSQSHLTLVRDRKKRQIENYFDDVFAQIKFYSNAKTTVEAMRSLKDSFPKFKEEAILSTDVKFIEADTLMKPVDEYKRVLRDYYVNDFYYEYGTLNVNEAPDMIERLNQLYENSIALQYHYIAANPNPLGTKEEYFAATDASSYTQLHRHYHPYFHDIQRQFDFEDIFLVDVDTGHVIYSVLKEIDFATSLKEGPYAKTGIGEVFQKVSQLRQGGIGGLVDFAPYLPSFDSQAAFIATPIYDGEEKIGILIFQISIHSINDIMTEQLVWLDDKYGRTGEAYIVGYDGDGTMRNDSRMLIEDKEGYLWAILRQAQLPENIIYNIELTDTTVGLQRVDTPGTRSAFSGVTGFDIYEDYQGEFVLSAFAPIDVPGLQWTIFSTLSEEESIEPLETLTTEIINKATLPISVVLILYFIYLGSKRRLFLVARKLKTS